jgi:hypothetical protein
MTLSDEELMAYVDDELDAETRAAVEERLAADPAACRRLAAQLRLQIELRRSFDPVLVERVPQHLIDAVRAPTTGARAVPGHRWYALAASVLLGVVVALAVTVGPRTRASLVVERDGVRAAGALAQVLSSQLSATPGPRDTAHVAISFVARDGRYCRAFTTADHAGLACRDGETWQVRALERLERSTADTGAYRQAASALPSAILIAAQNLMAGEPLDAADEKAARDRDWQRKPRD